MFEKSTHILLVDDMTSVRILMSKYLAELGYTKISQAENGKDALAKLNSLVGSNPIQLIITDLKMPVMDGVELLKQIRANTNLSKVPVILLTAEGEHSKLRNAITEDFCALIAKPANAHIFGQKLKYAWDTFHGKKT